MRLRLRDMVAGVVGAAALAIAPMAHAVPTSAFALAGLDQTDWTPIADPATGGLFGADGNSLFANGGALRLEAKEAAFNHQFGIAAADLTGFQPILDDVGFSGPFVVDLAPTVGSFVFVARNASGGELSGEVAASNGQRSDGRLDLAVLANILDPTRFLFFFDDGGGAGDDDDFNDMVVLATAFAAPVPEPATLGLIGAGLAGLGFLARRKTGR